MITNSRLGYSGRLGNQMYQFSILYILSILYGYDIKLPIENTINFIKVNYYLERNELFSVFNLNNNYLTQERNIKIDRIINKWGLKYYDEVLNLKDGSDIRGDFQSAKYYIPYKNDLLNLFKFKENILEKCNDYMCNINNLKKTVGIHIRRGDYVDLKNTIDKNYYISIINRYFNSDDYNFICVSDDVEWCKENLPSFINLSNSNNHGVDLCILTKCDHIIGANSTFSWWGSFLNTNNGKIFMPKLWFSETYKDFYKNDYDGFLLNYNDIIVV